MATSRNNPLFFIHTIDPLLWFLMMLFVRPFFRIVCFQYTGVSEIGFKRLAVDALSAEEFEQCQLAGLEFAKENDLARRCAARVTITTREVDLTNYLAKDILRSYTELLLSAAMIQKLPQPEGIFIVARRFQGKDLRDLIAGSFRKASGLRYGYGWQILLGWPQILGRVFFSFCRFWVYVAVVLMKKKKTLGILLKDKILVVANNPAELQSDLNHRLSAGFFVDGTRIKKENVIFLARHGLETEKWRAEGYCSYSLIDLATWPVHIQTICKLVAIFLSRPFFFVGLIVYFPSRVMYYLVLGDILVEKHPAAFQALLYANSDIEIEPIFSASFLAREIPVVLFYYSASTFPNFLWAYLQADYIFVWNNRMVSFLKGHPQGGNKKFFISGPLMQVEDQFQKITLENLRADLNLPWNDHKINIGIFDVAPIAADHLEDRRFVQNPKLTPQLYKDFLFDIFSLVDQSANVQMMLKPKRWTPRHDIAPEIRDFFKKDRKNIFLLPASLNPQVVIQSCHAVICFPFTSVFYAALQKGIPAIFYYPVQQDPGLENRGELAPFTIYGKENLIKWFADFRENRILLPSLPQIEDLCGVGLGISVRERFISQLANIL